VSIAAAIADYNRDLAADSVGAAEQAAGFESALVRAGVTFEGAAMRSSLRPHLIARADWDRLRTSAAQVTELAARAARHAFDGDVGALSAFLGMSAEESRYVQIDHGGPDVVWARVDAFLTPGGPRFIEINNDAPAGFGYADRMADVFRELPCFRTFAAGRALSHAGSSPGLIDSVLALWRERAGRDTPTIAIVDWEDVGTRADQEILREAFVARGVRCLLVDPRQLERSGGRLRCRDGAIDLVYRRVLLQDLLLRADEARALLDAYEAGEAVFCNPFRCRLSENKAFLSVLSDEDFGFLFSEEERALLGAVIPWTRRVEKRRTGRAGRSIDLMPHILEAREELILKPAHDYGGRFVLLGSEATPEEWARVALSGLDAPWVVQERVRIPEEIFPFVGPTGDIGFESLKLNVNPFYARGADVGAVARVSRSCVINVTSGGGSIPTFVLE
jgi:uncharacterized circularly permuted ATP-grasp superfamily protein